MEAIRFYLLNQIKAQNKLTEIKQNLYQLNLTMKLLASSKNKRVIMKIKYKVIKINKKLILLNQLLILKRAKRRVRVHFTTQGSLLLKAILIVKGHLWQENLTQHRQMMRVSSLKVVWVTTKKMSFLI